jgi:uncharacterized membrane protein
MAKKMVTVYALLISLGAAAAQMMGGYGEGGYGMMGAPGYGIEPNTSYYSYRGYQTYPYGCGGMPMGGYGMGGYGMMPMMGGYGGYGMMGAYPGYGMGYSGGWLLLLLFIAVAVVLIYYARGKETAPSRAKDILDMRLAKGEITQEEYKKLRGVIEG